MSAIDESYRSVFNSMHNERIQPPQKSKEFLHKLKIALKQTRNSAIDQCLTILKESRAFGMEEEITRIENLKEKI